MCYCQYFGGCLACRGLSWHGLVLAPIMLCILDILFNVINSFIQYIPKLLYVAKLLYVVSLQTDKRPLPQIKTKLDPNKAQEGRKTTAIVHVWCVALSLLVGGIGGLNQAVTF